VPIAAERGRLRDRLRLAKYRFLRYLPGDTGIRYTSRYRRGTGATARLFARALQGAAGSTCIDLGANVGDITLTMAEHGARVFAFEPDPWSAAAWRTRTAGLNGVELVEAAAGVTDATVRIYRHRGFGADPATASLSTSTWAEHGDVDGASGFAVRQIDFPAWLRALDTDVHILKIDIEGGEVPLLESLLDDSRLAARIGFVFAEMHGWIVPSLADRILALRRRTRPMRHPVIDLDWA